MLFLLIFIIFFGILNLPCFIYHFHHQRFRFLHYHHLNLLHFPKHHYHPHFLPPPPPLLPPPLILHHLHFPLPLHPHFLLHLHLLHSRFNFLHYHLHLRYPRPIHQHLLDRYLHHFMYFLPLLHLHFQFILQVNLTLHFLKFLFHAHFYQHLHH